MRDEFSWTWQSVKGLIQEFEQKVRSRFLVLWGALMCLPCPQYAIKASVQALLRESEVRDPRRPPP